VWRLTVGLVWRISGRWAVHGEHDYTKFEKDPDYLASQTGDSKIWRPGVRRDWNGVDKYNCGHRCFLVCASEKLSVFLKHWIGPTETTPSTIKLVKYITGMKMENQQRRSTKKSPRVEHTKAEVAHLLQRFLTVALPHEYKIIEFKAIRTYFHGDGLKPGHGYSESDPSESVTVQGRSQVRRSHVVTFSLAVIPSSRF
jgi:hypothetical protein